MYIFASNMEAAFYAGIRKLLIQSFLIATLLILTGFSTQAQESNSKRIALVIGNSTYENVAELKNPINDSADIASSLTSLGFEVMLHTNLTQGSMLDTFRGFRRQADKAEIALVYFAGHGIEIDRQNYLLPVDAVLETDSDVNFEAVKLETMIFAASGAERLSMIIVDACRNNPFAASMKRSNSSRAIGHGLSAVEPSRNTLVAYAAKEGTTAADGAGRNSPYASALIETLKQPGLEVGLMMRRVRDEVLKSTAGKQEPFVYGSLSADQIFLNETRSISPSETDFVVTDVELEDVPDASAAEIVFWKSIAGSSETPELETYLELYPNGFFAELARARINNATKNTQQQVVLNPVSPERLVPEIETTPDLTRSELIELQERLSILGYALGRADGIAGQRTEAAIRAYEKAEGLTISGLPTVLVLSELRKQVTIAELKNWRSNLAAQTKRVPAKSTRTKATPRAKTVTQPNVAAPKPKTVKPKAVSKPSKKYTQFCGANRQCGTSQCKAGASGDFFRKTRSCRFCTLYAQRCK